MIVTPDLSILPFVLKKGIKYFELVAQPVQREILPGLFINAWGYNGTTPGPTICVYPGDYVNIRVYNQLPEATSVHWHGLDVPNVMDGVPDVEPSPRIEPNHYFDYRFKIVNPPGTHMYHTHFDSATQQMLGLAGGFIILNPDKCHDQVNRDYLIHLQEFKLKDLEMGVIKPGLFALDPHSEDFNFFTMNGRCFPFVTPLEVEYGDVVRIRLTNSMMNAHPIHIHGHQFIVTDSDGNSIRQSKRLMKNTINVASGETFDIVFIADNPGRWPFHCHIPHHMANNMTKQMGGMSTVILYKERK